MKTHIDLNNVSVTYANGHRALSSVSGQLEGGKICGLVGVNGAGKSSLFKAIMGFVKPSSGTISIAGLPVRQALKKNLVSYVPQTEDVDWNFPVLVEDVVMMGRYAHMGFLRIPKAPDHKAVDDALERVGLSAFRKHQIGELSGGQKKRVFVARALAQNGHIVLLDEPFAGVDVKTEDSLISLFRSLAHEGRLILVSTHNLGTIPNFCDDVMLINKTLIAHGPVVSTFTNENLLKAFGGKLHNRHTINNSDIFND